jgi:hypothetical protein
MYLRACAIVSAFPDGAPSGAADLLGGGAPSEAANPVGDAFGVPSPGRPAAAPLTPLGADAPGERAHDANTSTARTRRQATPG